MNQKVFQGISFLNYWLDSVDEHSLHSPFLFDLYINVIKPSKRSANPQIEMFRQQLLNSRDSIEVVDFGAGSSHFAGSVRKVSAIAQTSLTPPKFAALYRNLILHFHAKTVLELGTSLGITTLYLAAPGTRTLTLEGSEAISKIARSLFERAGHTNIELVTGNIDMILPDVTARITTIDLLFMDAHHRYEATLKYFKQIEPLLHSGSIAVIDDIHYSREMEEAWTFLKSHDRVFATVDLFRCGLLFFDPSLNRQHVVLEY